MFEYLTCLWSNSVPEMLAEEMEKQKETRHQDRQTMTQMDFDARAAVRAGPDGRDTVVQDKLHSGL